MINKHLLLLLALLACCCTANTQQYKLAIAGFYNCENFYDTINDPNTIDEEFLPDGDKHYNSTVYHDKLDHLSTVISQMGTDISADGVALLAADKPDSFVDDTPTAVLVRQILGAVAQFDKAMTVAKLRGARERKRRKTGQKVEGRKSYAEVNPELVGKARELSAQRPRLSLRQISAELFTADFKTPNGKPYSASAVASMLR